MPLASKSISNITIDFGDHAQIMFVSKYDRDTPSQLEGNRACYRVIQDIEEIY